ncbi:MAG: DUF2007 domain-containing protein [Planctomycetes bacterium]|nr:DUF2007 domain-containing protein [Planctomycetota bacterium]
MEKDDLVTVYTLHDSIKAAMIKNALLTEGIRCLLAGIEQASTAGLPGTIIQVQVAAIDGDRARKIIERHQP